jgi:hypothetical protein
MKTLTVVKDGIFRGTMIEKDNKDFYLTTYFTYLIDLILADKIIEFHLFSPDILESKILSKKIDSYNLDENKELKKLIEDIKNWIDKGIIRLIQISFEYKEKDIIKNEQWYIQNHSK